MTLADELTSELYGPTVVDGDLLDPPADAFARLENEDIRPVGCEIACRRKTGKAGAHDQDVPHVPSTSDGAGVGDSTSTRRAWRGRCAFTASPSRYVVSSPTFVTSACKRASEGSRRCT